MSNIRIELKNETAAAINCGLEPEGDYFEVQPNSKRIVEFDTASSVDKGISFSVQANGNVVIVSSMRKTAI